MSKECPWEDVEIITKDCWKNVIKAPSVSEPGCMVQIVSGLRNESDACEKEHFIHIMFMNVNGEIREEMSLGPYFTPMLQTLLRVFGNLKDAYFFNR